MGDFMYEYPIEWKDSFHIRKPVLEKILPNTRWQVSEDGSKLLLDYAINVHSPHEIHIINFALNPFHTAEGIFSGLDQPVCEELIQALTSLFGSNGIFKKMKDKKA